MYYILQYYVLLQFLYNFKIFETWKPLVWMKKLLLLENELNGLKYMDDFIIKDKRK